MNPDDILREDLDHERFLDAAEPDDEPYGVMTAAEFYGEVLAAQYDVPDMDVYGGGYSEM